MNSPAVEVEPGPVNASRVQQGAGRPHHALHDLRHHGSPLLRRRDVTQLSCGRENFIGWPISSDSCCYFTFWQILLWQVWCNWQKDLEITQIRVNPT